MRTGKPIVRKKSAQFLSISESLVYKTGSGRQYTTLNFFIYFLRDNAMLLFFCKELAMLPNVFVEIFSKLTDPRVERTKKHLFLDVIGLALFAVLAGAQAYTEIEDFSRHHADWLKCLVVRQWPEPGANKSR